MKKLFTLLVANLLIFQSVPIPLYAQDDDSDDVFELSPFQVNSSRDRGYRSSSTLSGTRLKTELKDVASAITVLTNELLQDSGASILHVDDASETQFARANGVIVRFAIGYFDDLEKNRRDHLKQELQKIQSLVSDDPSLYYTPGALKIAKGDRKRFKTKPRSHFTSYAHFSLSFAMQDGLSPLKRVAAVRDRLASLKLDTDVTKLYFGEALLVYESPFSTPAYNASHSPMLRTAQATSDIGASIANFQNRLGKAIRETVPACPVTIIRPADSVSIRFAFDTQTSSESERIQILNIAIETVRELTERDPAFHFETGSMLLRHGDKEGDFSKSTAAFTSQAQFDIRFNLPSEQDSMEAIRNIRKLVQEAELPDSISKIHFGPASLVLEDSQRYRGEILQAIFTDIAALQENVSKLFEIIPELKVDRVQQRRHSPTEVELWIPYTYKLDSLRARANAEKRQQQEHERALALAESQNRGHHCHLNCQTVHSTQHATE